MTIKLKIILGFISLMAITITASLIGYRSIDTSIRSFNNYIVFAKSDEQLAEFLNHFGRAYASAFSYITYNKEEEIKNIPIFMDEAIKNLDNMLKTIDSPQKREEVKLLKKYSQQYQNEAIEFCNLLNVSKKTYAKVIRPCSINLMISLNKLSERAEELGNTRLLGKMNSVWIPYAKLLSAYGRYINSTAVEDKKKVLLWLNKSLEAIENLRPAIHTDYGREVFNEVKESVKAIESATHLIIKNVDESSQKGIIVSDIRKEIFEKSTILNKYVDQKKDESYAIAKNSNATGRQNIFISSIIGVIIGLTLACFIIMSLIHVLKNISGFATAIANGSFSDTIQSKEKGEVGEMVDSMKQIPTVLQKLIDEIVEGIKKIQIGEFNTRLKPSEYKGSYVNIVDAVNTVADAYTSLLDELPIPLLTANKNYEVFYTNKESRKILNGRLIESYVTDGEKEFGRKAIERGTNYIAEANFKKDGKAMSMSVTAVPLKDSKGAFPTFIEILTDLTAIREQQKVMLQVAEEATEISIRVATTSEEIASQVEQVSRGADIQRTRVESTASAMTEMNSTVIEVARSAGDAAKQSDSTMSKAQDGAELVNKVMSAINQVNHVSQNLHTNMQELGTQAENIGSVMNVISDIADQTNLLALNAAIEAARAGEAGRGFAVVADEVRKLAEKTMLATQEVGSSINAVQHSTRTNIEEVSRAVKSVEEANQLANSSGEALGEIVSLASANSDIVSSIATAAEQQSATSDEISQSIDEINNIASETAEGMIQSSSAIQNLSVMAQDLRRVMRGLR